MLEPEFIAALLSWAVQLTSYSAPAVPPTISYQPHSYFVEHVCKGKKCGAHAWYDNQGAIILDQRFEGVDSALTRGIIVHEMVHYLQDMSGKYDVGNCETYLLREREAYAIQREFIARAMGQAAFIRMRLWEC